MISNVEVEAGKAAPARALVNECLRLPAPVGVLLIGSQADGTADAASDWDFVLVLDRREAWRILPFLPAIRRRLQAAVATSVSVNPVWRSTVQESPQTAYQWKLRSASRTLHWPSGWDRLESAPFPATPPARTSWAMAGACLLFAAYDELANRNSGTSRALLKAQRHIAVLAPSLDAHGLTPMDVWFAVRDEVVGYLRPAQTSPSPLAELASAARWCATGHVPRSRRRLERDLIIAARLLLTAISPNGVDVSRVEDASRTAPGRALGIAAWSDVAARVADDWRTIHVLALQ